MLTTLRNSSKNQYLKLFWKSSNRINHKLWYVGHEDLVGVGKNNSSSDCW